MVMEKTQTNKQTSKANERKEQPSASFHIKTVHVLSMLIAAARPIVSLRSFSGVCHFWNFFLHINSAGLLTKSES